MMLLACLEAAGLVVVVVATLLLRREEQREIARERAELLNRIQHPELLPRAAAPQYVVPEAEDDFSELVGTIAYDTPED